MHDKTSLTAFCYTCGHHDTFAVKNKDLAAWKNGSDIEEVMPYLTDNQRRMMVSEYCVSCWITNEFCR